MNIHKVAALLFVLMTGTLAYAVQNLQQTITITTTAAAFTGATSLSVSNVQPCDAPCNGILVSGTPGAVTFTVTSLNAGWTSTGTTPTAVALITTQSSCGASPSPSAGPT